MCEDRELKDESLCFKMQKGRYFETHVYQAILQKKTQQLIELLKTNNTKELMNLSRYIKEATVLRNDSLLNITGVAGDIA